MKQKLLLLYIACCLFACKPEPDRTPDKHIYYYLTAEQLAKTPYFTNPYFDTLTFVSNQNDTVVFAKTRVDSSWYRLSASNLSHNYETILYYQQLSAKYQTIKGDGSFEVVHSKENGLSVELIKILFMDVDFKFFPGWFEPNFGYEFFTKDTLLNNTIYNNVIKVINLNEPNEPYLLATQKLGVIKYYSSLQNKSLTLLINK